MFLNGWRKLAGVEPRLSRRARPKLRQVRRANVTPRVEVLQDRTLLSAGAPDPLEDRP